MQFGKSNLHTIHMISKMYPGSVKPNFGPPNSEDQAHHDIKSADLDLNRPGAQHGGSFLPFSAHLRLPQNQVFSAKKSEPLLLAKGSQVLHKTERVSQLSTN
ncbi:hypothetical protein AVEN_155727-1 [Araneus ventricosus]|uniref:Uncharacterized protein n=1 Tax=Araneus ventricosus TaxID=182803 RepID=A0A4Y2VDY0_ARAVE|nr:hypothetical protein AVEN_155727-1 [Araneus ventricosus]